MAEPSSAPSPMAPNGALVRPDGAASRRLEVVLGLLGHLMAIGAGVALSLVTGIDWLAFVAGLALWSVVDAILAHRRLVHERRARSSQPGGATGFATSRHSRIPSFVRPLIGDGAGLCAVVACWWGATWAFGQPRPAWSMTGVVVGIGLAHTVAMQVGYEVPRWREARRADAGSTGTREG